MQVSDLKYADKSTFYLYRNNSREFNKMEIRIRNQIETYSIRLCAMKTSSQQIHTQTN